MYYVGIDIGSTASKAVVLDEDKHTVLHKRVVPSGWNSKETGEQLLQWIYSQGFIRDQLKIIATVYEPNTKRILAYRYAAFNPELEAPSNYRNKRRRSCL